MAVIRKKIENLKVGREYIATVRAKNTDLNVYSDFTDSIRFVVPSDSTIPEVLQNFKLYASYKNVMFVFDNSNERDVVAYEYELYHQDDITGPEPFEINSDADPVISGVGYSNVISVPLTEDYIQGYSNINTTVDGDGNEVQVRYYGRVRAVDSSNNIGDWTPIQESEDTKLIDEEFIVNLTASKITAGTIKASEIILAQAGASTTITTPANVSVLRSANYNGTYNSGTSTWTPGTQGWIVAGTGYAEFDSAVIRGGLKAGSVFINTNNRWNADTSGNPYASGNVNEGYFKAGSSTKYVEWNPATNTLNIAGNLVGATGSFSGSLSAATGTFAGSLSAATGTFAGSLSAATGTFAGSLSAATGTFAGTLSAGISIVSPLISGGAGNFSGTVTVGTNATLANRITIVSSATSADTKIYSGTGTYDDVNTGFYLDASGRFSLKKSLTWSGTVLQITGSFRSGTGSGRIDVGGFAGDDRDIRFTGNNGGQVSIRNPEDATTVNQLRINVSGSTYNFTSSDFSTFSNITGGRINGAIINLEAPLNHLRVGTPSGGSMIKILNSSLGVQVRDADDTLYYPFRCSVLTKSSGTFRINHPLSEMSKSHDLIHSFIEGPYADLIYRGSVKLSNGRASINLDDHSRMTHGTFLSLNRNVTCFTSNEEGWSPVKGLVNGSILDIYSLDEQCNDMVSWIVIGERKDASMYDLSWTDDNGRVLTEVLKEHINE